MPKSRSRRHKYPPVYLVSGGSGTSGNLIVETVLAQFPEVHVPVIVLDHVGQKKRVDAVVAEAAAAGGMIVHTLVDDGLRKVLIRSGKKQGVTTVDLMGPLLGRLAEALGQKPLGRPGLYRQLHRDYFKRIEAIEFSVAHDDGQRPWELPSAEVVLLGVSRSGKTPLSMYLATLGWMAANVPIVPGIPLPPELDSVDNRRMIGLLIDFEHLMDHRRKRQERMGETGPSSYAAPGNVFEELETAQRIYRQRGLAVVGVTNKPLETIADEIIGLIRSAFG